MYDIFHSYGFDKPLNESLADAEYEWKFVDSKSVHDFDGFLTEYIWYTDGDKHIFMLGDSDITEPSETYADRVCDSKQEAAEWFETYNGFDDEDFLTEAFSSGIPAWLKTFIERSTSIKRILNSHHIDLANATYVRSPFPRSNRDPILKDPYKQIVWRLEINGRDYIYMPGVNNPEYYHRQSGNYRYLDTTAMRDIIEYAYEFGYIDLSDSSNLNTNVQQERSQLRSNSSRNGFIQRDPDRGLHPVSKKRYDDDGNPYYELMWVTASGYDKSGYPLNPDKYVKMLDDVGLNDYSKRLTTYYNKIEQHRKSIVELMTSAQIDATDYAGATTFSDNIFEDIAEASKLLGRAINSYKTISSTCEKIVNRSELSDEEKSERIKNSFKWDARFLRDYIKELAELIAKLKEN